MIYIVKTNDTIYSIARELSVQTGKQISPEIIIAQNGLLPPYNTVVGQALFIPIPETYYTVRQNDTIESIARAFSVDKITLWQNNPQLKGSEILYPGQTIIISYVSERPKVKGIVTGYAYPFINPTTLSLTLPYLCYVIPFTYGFDENGELIAADDDRILNEAKKYGTETLLHLSTLTREGRFDSNLAAVLLSNEELQKKLITNLTNKVLEKGYGGIDIDFEFVEARYAEAYSNFVNEVTNAMRAYGLTSLVALAPKTYDEQPGLLYEAHRYGPLGEAADGVLLMTYEWGYTYGPPMAVAPINNVRAVAEYALTRIPKEKILLGIPNYGYDWTLPYEKGNMARSLSNVEAIDLAYRYGSEIAFDEESKTPYFYYTDEDGKQHVVWFEDPRSITSKIDLIRELGLAGAGIWNTYRSFPALWGLLAENFNICE